MLEVMVSVVVGACEHFHCLYFLPKSENEGDVGDLRGQKEQNRDQKRGKWWTPNFDDASNAELPPPQKKEVKWKD